MFKLTLSKLPKKHIQRSVDDHAGFWLHQDGCKHGRIDEHATLEEQMQGPLRAVVLVPADCPRFHQDLGQRRDGAPYCRLLSVPALPYPRRIDVLGHVVCVRVREEPGDYGRGHGRQYEAS